MLTEKVGTGLQRWTASLGEKYGEEGKILDKELGWMVGNALQEIAGIVDKLNADMTAEFRDHPEIANSFMEALRAMVSP